MNCEHVLEKLDVWIDRELGVADSDAIVRHVEGCEICSRVLLNRKALRTRLRDLAQSVEPPGGLHERVCSRIESDRAENRKQWNLLAIAAAALLAIGSYSALHRDSAMMRIGVNQHIHCAVARTYPAQEPEMSSLIAGTDTAYAALIPVMQAHVPPDYRVVMAHQCDYRGRQYIHVIARRGTDLISLLVTKRGPGEAFQDDLRAAAVEDGVPEYASTAQRYSVAGFQTPEYLVYLVSDLSPDQNLAGMKAMTRQVKAALGTQLGSRVSDRRAS